MMNFLLMKNNFQTHVSILNNLENCYLLWKISVKSEKIPDNKNVFLYEKELSNTYLSLQYTHSMGESMNQQNRFL